RVARVTDQRDGEVQTPHGQVPVQFAPRPFPSGGGLYELETYVAIRACKKLSPGLYYYDPAGHRLIRLREQTAEVAGFVNDAPASAAVPSGNLQVLPILAARFARLAWKYQSIAHSLMPKTP